MGLSMALRKKGKYSYGTTSEDTQAELLHYSQCNKYEAVQFAESVCVCGNRFFKLESDAEEGAARRVCTSCGIVHLMGDSDEYVDDAVFKRHPCVCLAEDFELLSGAAIYRDSNDIRWYYIGCQCTHCHLVGVFVDWKCDGGDAGVFLSKV